MDFYHQDKIYFNPDFYDSKGLRKLSNPEKFLEYFLETMRDYERSGVPGIFNNFSPDNFEIT
jgi:hypothetical protein